MFAELMQKLHAQSGKQVVILIDEYDKPITDVLEFGKTDKAHEHLGILRTLYSVLKGNSEHIRFFFMTGIARFSKVSLFSDLNNLSDISYHEEYHNLVGYTQHELETIFCDHLNFISGKRGLTTAQLLAQIKDWYNGFSWDGEHKVYNPYSILRYLDEKTFRNFWFETGTPRFLIEKMKEIQVYDVSNTTVDALTAENLNIDDVQLVPLLFQTGYLTIKQKDPFGGYLLDYPNKEVHESMLKHILMSYAHSIHSITHATNIIRSIFANDLDQLIREINILFASIPYQIFDSNQERYFHAILFLSLKICGFHIESEVSVSTGRIDAVLIHENKVYIFEFKLNDSADAALQQIREKQYFKKYENQGKELFLVGIGFSGKTKEVSDWKVETV
jgi:predicted DNA-binding ribbon-helix-helix protein